MSDKGKMLLCADPGAQFKAHAPEIRAAIERVLESGWYILGKEVTEFENEFADYLGVKHCIGVGNGTDAIVIALRACGIKPGDEVITVSHSAVATVAAIEQIGAKAVLCDISPDSHCINPALIEQLITPQTKAIVPVHIYGHPCDMTEICRIASQHGLKVMEDCAQAHGAAINGKKVGSFGDVAAFSFYPTKNLGAIGDGGAVVTSDSSVAEQAAILRQYGWKERYISLVPGINTRLDELQAAILRVKLKYLDADNQKRNSIADRYDQLLRGTSVVCPERPTGYFHAMHLYVIQVQERDALKSHIQSQNIQAALHYPAAIHQQPAYGGNRLRGSDCLPVTELFYKHLLSLPMYPELSVEQQDSVLAALESWLKSQ